MEEFIIHGGNKLSGTISVGGAKNVAMKVILAGLLTDEKIIIHGVPHISSVTGTADIVRPLGLKIDFVNHVLIVDGAGMKGTHVPLEVGSLYRTATMVIGPLLARFGKAIVPNPGGCRIGQRPIDLHIQAIEKMGAKIEYHSSDGYFYATAKKLKGTTIHFEKNTHTGTETVLLAAVLAEGETIIENAAQEPEIDDLISLLCAMGANITRVSPRKIRIIGVKKMHGTTYRIMSDRNEAVTFAIAALATKGDIVVEGAQREYLKSFIEKLIEIGAGIEDIGNNSMRFYYKNKLSKSDIITLPHPGFMTDWQAPWALLMTQVTGSSTIHETIFEDRFSYVKELEKMGANISFFTPKITNPAITYNFHLDGNVKSKQAIRITGPTPLHNGILKTTDLRAGATLVLAALIAEGVSHVHEIEHIDRGYESLDTRLKQIGADIKRATI